MLNEHLCRALTGSVANDKVHGTCAATQEDGAGQVQAGRASWRRPCGRAGEGSPAEAFLAEEEQVQRPEGQRLSVCVSVDTSVGMCERECVWVYVDLRVRLTTCG